MAARGARSRKTVEKQIKKEEKKEATKGYISDLSKKASSPSGNWGIPSRPPSSQASQNAQVRRSGYSPSLRSIASGESRSGTQAPSEGSSETKPKEKYAAKGKGSKAPRGRGGGVPTKTSEMGNPKGRETPLTNINAPSRSLRTSASNLSRAGRSGVEKERIWSRYKIWDGPRHTRPYKGLEDVRLPFNLADS